MTSSSVSHLGGRTPPPASAESESPAFYIGKYLTGRIEVSGSWGADDETPCRKSPAVTSSHAIMERLRGSFRAGAQW